MSLRNEQLDGQVHCEEDGISETETCVRGSGWHRGMRSDVRLHAMIAASWATVRTSPLERAFALAFANSLCSSDDCISSECVVEETRSNAWYGRKMRPRAVADRDVASLSETSTIEGRPVSSICVNLACAGIRVVENVRKC